MQVENPPYCMTPFTFYHFSSFRYLKTAVKTYLKHFLLSPTKNTDGNYFCVGLVEFGRILMHTISRSVHGLNIARSRFHRICHFCSDCSACCFDRFRQGSTAEIFLAQDSRGLNDRPPDRQRS